MPLNCFAEVPPSPKVLLDGYSAAGLGLNEDQQIFAVLENVEEWTKYYCEHGGGIDTIIPYVRDEVKKCAVGGRISDVLINRTVAKTWHAHKAEHGSLESARRQELYAPNSFDSAFKQTESSWRSQGQLFCFGIDELDNAMGGGVYEGQMLSVIGNPGSMKTSLLLNGLQRWVGDGGNGAVLFSLDMGRVPIMERLLAREMGCSPAKVKELGKIGAPEYARARESLTNFYDGRLTVLENDLNLRWTVEKIKEYAERNVPKVVCIDYLTLLKEGEQSDFDIANHATEELLRLAKTYGFALVVLSQMSMESQRLQAQGGMGGSARGGGYVNERADIEIELFKDTGDDENGHDLGAEIIATIKKTRKNGANGSFRLDYIGEQMRFKSTAAKVSRVKRKKKIFGHADTSWHGAA